MWGVVKEWSKRKHRTGCRGTVVREEDGLGQTAGDQPVHPLVCPATLYLFLCPQEHTEMDLCPSQGLGHKGHKLLPPASLAAQEC